MFFSFISRFIDKNTVIGGTLHVMMLTNVTITFVRKVLPKGGNFFAERMFFSVAGCVGQQFK